VSTTGGTYPRWSHDAKEVFYIGPAGELMAAPITITSTSVDVGTPATLFQTRTYVGSRDTIQGWQYDVTRDGRILMNTVVEDAPPAITLLMNWHPEPKK
jgi:hypothetical protein